MKDVRIAILLTCHNRREKTLFSLEALFKQVLGLENSLQVYLVDDGSSDRTQEAVQLNYPEVKVLQGDGNLFWNGGMRLAFSEALKTGHDYYLWLNDDTQLEPDALSNLLNTHYQLAEQGKPNSIVVGSTRDGVTGELTYGGVVRPNRWRRLAFKRVEPSKERQECETMNGNCVLIPHTVAEKVGNLDNAFTHGIGDYDYGLRARRLGCSVWIAPEYVGTCSRNLLRGGWEDTNLPLGARWKKVRQVKGLALKEWKIFASRYAGPFWYIYWLSPYIRLISSSAFKKLGFIPKQV